jgi:hypothetical protein
MNRPVLSATIRAALDATGAPSGWIVVQRDGRATVIAVGGDCAASVGDVVSPTGPAALAIATGQPSSRSIAADEETARGAGGSHDVPGWLLTIPVGDGAAALELAKPPGAEAFGIDDIEIVSLLADIAEAALDEQVTSVPTPDELAGELRRLHNADAARYAIVAATLSSMLGNS